jgi:hypothetical protein
VKKIKQKTKNRILAVLLLIGLIVLIIDGINSDTFITKYKNGHCGFYRWVIGSIKMWYVGCEGNRNVLQDYMGYFMMIFNPITVIIICSISVLKEDRKE